MIFPAGLLEAPAAPPAPAPADVAAPPGLAAWLVRLLSLPLCFALGAWPTLRRGVPALGLAGALRAWLRYSWLAAGGPNADDTRGAKARVKLAAAEAALPADPNAGGFAQALPGPGLDSLLADILAARALAAARAG